MIAVWSVVMTINKMIKSILGTNLGCAFVIGGMLFPTFGFSAEVQSIEFAALPGDQTEIKVTFDEAPPLPRGYTIERPARIALDLIGLPYCMYTLVVHLCCSCIVWPS